MMAACAELAADMDRFGIGANGPPEDQPEPDPFEALEVHAKDLLDQARGVTKVETQEQLDAVKALEGELADALSLLDDMRTERKKPLDDQIADIQATFNVYIAPLKNKVPGKIPLAQDALRKAKEPFLKKLEDDRIAAAAEAQRIADAAIAAAAEAARVAEPEDLEAREEAEELIQQASSAIKVATKAAATITKGSGLRSRWVPTLTDSNAALAHYIVTRPDDVKACLLELARTDIAASVRSIPGFTITEERYA